MLKTQRWTNCVSLLLCVIVTQAVELRLRYASKLENLKVIVDLFDAHVELVQRAAGLLWMFIEARNEAVLATLATLKAPLLQALETAAPDEVVARLKSKLAEL